VLKSGNKRGFLPKRWNKEEGGVLESLNQDLGDLANSD